MLRERRFTETVPVFDAALDKAPESLALKLGRAVALLNRQPRTRDNVAQADAQFVMLAREAGDIGLSARYLRARVAEVHLFEPDLKIAAARYEALIADAPHSALAQFAVAKLVRLRVYQLDRDPLAELASAEAWAGKLSDAPARRDYHQIMGRSYLFFKVSPERALAHLEAARAAGLLIPAQRASAAIATGELARELGRTDVARAAYEDFLRDHKRDQRVYMVTRRLEELGTDEGGVR